MNSLCIPRAMSYTTTADVEKVFNTLFAGNFVERVDERKVTDSHGQDFKMFYIHFTQATSREMENFNRKMEADGMVQVMTGRGKWFWKVYLNKSTRADRPVRVGPRIMTEEDEQLFLQWKEARNASAAEEPASDPVFTNEELNTLDVATRNGFTEEELEELDSENDAMETHKEETELMEMADEMARTN